MKKHFLLLIGFSLVFILSHLFLLNFFLDQDVGIFSVSIIHIYIFVLTFLFFVMIDWLNKKNKKSPFLFLSLNFIKMFLCMVFLIPIIRNYNPTNLPYILHFFLVYFGYLFAEIYLLIKLNK